jgi:LacI family transcriptional regulator
VLTKKKFVSPELEERVSKAIKKLNYRPNSYARNLKVNRSNHIGVLVPDNTNPFFAEIVKYIQRIMSRNNYQIVLSSSDNDPKQEFQIIDSFLNTGVDGIVNIASRMTDSDLEAVVKFQW